VSQKVTYGDIVNPKSGTTKVGKRRKRSSHACITCREKKIRCDPRDSKCAQCKRFGRECKYDTERPKSGGSVPFPKPSGLLSPPAYSQSSQEVASNLKESSNIRRRTIGEDSSVSLHGPHSEPEQHGPRQTAFDNPPAQHSQSSWTSEEIGASRAGSAGSITDFMFAGRVRTIGATESGVVEDSSERDKLQKQKMDQAKDESRRRQNWPTKLSAAVDESSNDGSFKRALYMPLCPPTKSDWERFGPIIAQLYKDHSLKMVIFIVRDEYGFKARQVTQMQECRVRYLVSF
jgi:Fungal Zn(2)-Cys(6) binuclear cluster domain